MKRKNFILCVTPVFLVTFSILFSGCSRVNQLIINGKKNLEISKNLPNYTLNETNLKEITFDNKTYIIQESSVSQNELDKPIGKVSKQVTIDENNKVLNKDELRKIYILPNDKIEEKRIYLSFGWIYSVKNTYQNETIAVNVNNQYKLAKLKK
ncbi:NisI/SpaI family lantibiotic immunity lipoprotein [Clostridium sp.]|uniref:NisI/SpaI family lantibiotic immunity lipoprotein n=1 Tax=Clostridium sp. TaxID=1506 RepID=UPI002637BD51|nr:NisI/SpaI family lantibiotic immunity lipoprotein [Clostridium sp.]